VANTYLLVIRKKLENDGAIDKLDIGDIIEYKAELPDGSAPWFGRVALMSDAADGHGYGGVHTILKVIGMSVAKADQYIHPQLGYDSRDPNRNPNLRKRSWHLDMGKVPANHKAKLEGNKPMPFTAKFENNANPNLWKHKPGIAVEDDVMTLAEFESWMTFKPIIPAV